MDGLGTVARASRATTESKDDYLPLPNEALLEPKGKPFNPGSQNEAEVGSIARSLPTDSIYGCAILLWLNTSPQHRFPTFFVYGNGVVPLVASYVVQLSLGAYLYAVVVEEAHDCGGGSPMLRLVATSTFMQLGLRDLVESLEMHLWLSEFPTVGQMELLRFQKFADKHPVAQEEYGESAAVTRPVSGLTYWERAAFYVFIIGGKVLVAILITVAGAGLVLRSKTDHELIRNAVAAGFVMQQDKVIFQLCISHTIKLFGSKCPSIGIHEVRAQSFHNCRHRAFAWWAWECVLMVLALVAGCYAVWCS